MKKYISLLALVVGCSNFQKEVPVVDIGGNQKNALNYVRSSKYEGPEKIDRFDVVDKKVLELYQKMKEKGATHIHFAPKDSNYGFQIVLDHKNSFSFNPITPSGMGKYFIHNSNKDGSLIGVKIGAKWKFIDIDPKIILDLREDIAETSFRFFPEMFYDSEWRHLTCYKNCYTPEELSSSLKETQKKVEEVIELVK